MLSSRRWESQLGVTISTFAATAAEIERFAAAIFCPLQIALNSAAAEEMEVRAVPLRHSPPSPIARFWCCVQVQQEIRKGKEEEEEGASTKVHSVGPVS